MHGVFLDNVKGSEISGMLRGLDPDKRYVVSVQAVEDRASVVADLLAGLAGCETPKETADKTDAEIMDMVNAAIEENRLRESGRQPGA
ncbi:hypothetical protein [Desulfolutivibrio sulfoxidireducens]|uniref:hypothetical protein n=1 Tax=Desulfolutivibrio sulfoxidireducens TaxID=2773299 RepID=UPI00159D59C5|nr:hypothetical protein [Desulfolutivibrio sulfoxidireducens]